MERRTAPGSRGPELDQSCLTPKAYKADSIGKLKQRGAEKRRLAHTGPWHFFHTCVDV